MNPKWLPKTPAGRRARLREEMGEILQVDSKADRFGLDTRYDFERHCVTTDVRVESNREAFLREIEDLIIAIAAVVEDLRDSPPVVEARGGCHDWTSMTLRCPACKSAGAG